MPDLREEVIPHIPRLRRYARALTPDKEKADDLVQDCLERAIRNGHRFRDGTNLRSWLFTILHNVFVDDVRWRASRPTATLSDNLISTLGQGPGQEASLQLNQLKSAIEALPAAQRSVILLVGLEGLTYEEAAVVTGTAVGTVKSRLSRAREMLRRETEAKSGTEDGDSGETEAGIDEGVERLRGRAPAAASASAGRSAARKRSRAAGDRAVLQDADEGTAPAL